MSRTPQEANNYECDSCCLLLIDDGSLVLYTWLSVVRPEVRVFSPRGKTSQDKYGYVCFCWLCWLTTAYLCSPCCSARRRTEYLDRRHGYAHTCRAVYYLGSTVQASRGAVEGLPFPAKRTTNQKPDARDRVRKHSGAACYLPTSSLRLSLRLSSAAIAASASATFLLFLPSFVPFGVLDPPYNNSTSSLALVILKVCLSLHVRYCRICYIRVRVIASSCLSPTWRLDPHLLLTLLSCPRISSSFPCWWSACLRRGIEGLHQ